MDRQKVHWEIESTFRPPGSSGPDGKGEAPRAPGERRLPVHRPEKRMLRPL